MPPAEGKEAAAVTLLHGACHRRHRDTDTDELIIFVAIDNQRDKTRIEHRQVSLHILVDLTLREFHIAIEVFIGLVDQFEDIMRNIPLLDLLSRYLLNMKIITFLDERGEFGKLLRRLLRHGR